ncbi:hypothetical protein ACW9HL_22820 [Nocardia gipuzkoensis]
MIRAVPAGRSRLIEVDADVLGAAAELLDAGATVSTMEIDAPVAGRALVVVVDDQTFFR